MDSVLRCRNYYFDPKGGDVQHPYRAVHFQIAHSSGYPYELQVMTHAAEVVSYLEHPVRFKRQIQLPTPEHGEWLSRLCKGALVYDVFGAGPEPVSAMISRLRWIGRVPRARDA